MHVQFAAAALNRVAIANNAADCGGGLGLYSSTVTLDGVDISNNQGVYSGGGIYAYLSDLTLNSGGIYDNTSVGGGGVTAGYGTLTLAGGAIYSNTALTGGGVGQDATLMLLSGTQIISNQATYGGGVALDGLGIRVNSNRRRDCWQYGRLYGRWHCGAGRRGNAGGRPHRSQYRRPWGRGGVVR